MKPIKANLTDPAFRDANFDGPPYVCKCGYSTKKMSTFKTHLKKQVPCVEKISSEFICDCYEDHKNAKALEKHKKGCVVIKRKDIYNKKNVAISNGNNNGNNNVINNGNNNTTTIINNITNNIIPEYLSVWPYTQKNKFICLNSTEHEHLMKIDDNFDPYITYFKLTHCNPDRRTLHNLYYPNESKSTIHVYNGTEWIDKDINLITANIMKFESLDLTCFINSNFCTNEKTQKKIKKRIEQIDPTNKKSSVSNAVFFDERSLLQNQLKDMLFKCSPLVKKTYDLTIAKRNNFEQYVITYTLSKSSDSTSSESMHNRKNNYELSEDINISISDSESDSSSDSSFKPKTKTKPNPSKKTKSTWQSDDYNSQSSY